MATLSKNSIITVTKKTCGWWVMEKKNREILLQYSHRSLRNHEKGAGREEETDNENERERNVCRFLHRFLYFSLQLLHKAAGRLWCNNPFECCHLVPCILIEFFAVRRLGKVWQLMWGTWAFPDLSLSLSLTHTAVWHKTNWWFPLFAWSGACCRWNTDKGIERLSMTELLHLHWCTTTISTRTLDIRPNRHWLLCLAWFIT